MIFWNGAVRLLSAYVVSLTCTASILCSILLPVAAAAQDSTFQQQQDKLLTADQIKKRSRIVATANIVGYSVAMAGLYKAWYKDYPQSSFHTFNDAKEWMGMDKIGHVYSAYAEGKMSMEVWRWTGISRNKRIWLGGLTGVVYQTAIEVLDGFSEEWGWSWADIGANFAGSALLVGQELAWDEQKIQMKWSFHRKQYEDPARNMRSDKLFGSSSPSRFIKDYNGQVYWLSTGINNLVPGSNLPDWLQLSVGTGVEGVFGGFENYETKNGVVTFDGRHIQRSRQWYLSPDIDLTRIKTNRKGVKIALGMLNIFKFPMPAIELIDGKVKGRWLAF